MLAPSWNDWHGEDAYTAEVLALSDCCFRRDNRLHPFVRCSDPNAAPPNDAHLYEEILVSLGAGFPYTALPRESFAIK
jgi:hypothetical protein